MDNKRKTEREKDKKETGGVSNREAEREIARDMVDQKDHLLLLGDSRKTSV